MVILVVEFDKLASTKTVEKTKKALKEKGYQVFVVDRGSDALEKIKSLIPSGASVMNGSSVSLETIGYQDYLKNGNGGWVDLHKKVDAESDPQKRSEVRKEATISDFYLGSVHALTTDGQMIIASNTGSQLPSIAYNSTNLIFVIGTQKIVTDLETGMKRLEEYVYPLEDKHMQSLYGIGTNLSKVLIFKKENFISKREINIILVKEILGF